VQQYFERLIIHREILMPTQQWPRARCRILGALVVLCVCGALPVRASGGVVSDCSSDAQFSSLLATGGTITFNCGAGPHTIPISGQKSINLDTTIDGGGTITLDGQNKYRLFDVGATFTLRGLVLSRAFFDGDGGAIRNTSNGRLILEGSTIRDSHATLSGGAILSTGPMTISNSLLAGNTALNGGALYPRFAGARTTIVNSVLRDNQATDTTDGWGGAILAWDGAPVTIDSSDIISNTATSGGGIYNFANSVLTIQNNTRLRDNLVFKWGGGLYNEGTATLRNTILSSNVGYYCGGGIFNFQTGVATLTDVTLSGNGNDSREGGGMCNSGATTTLANVTFSGNSANTGGGFYNASGNATLANVTFSGNTATNTGGGINQTALGTTALTNVTLIGNSAPNGGGIYRNNTFNGTVVVKNSIVANSPRGGNCAGVVINSGFNLSNDSSCGFTQVPNVRLGPLANNGGPTLTHMPQSGSPAIDLVVGSCPPPATDQRGVGRPVDGDRNGTAFCDAGAVESGAIVPILYLPLVRK
jgi:predicted outer membrane repeat protein